MYISCKRHCNLKRGLDVRLNSQKRELGVQLVLILLNYLVSVLLFGQGLRTR